MKKALFIPLLLMITISAAPRFNGFLQNWSAYNLNDDRNVFLLRNRLRLNTTLSGDWARGYGSVDFSDERQLTPALQEVNIRELYFDLYFEKFDLRVGKQQVIWGKADGVFINDIVNPLDLRYFLMQDFDDIRMGTNMLRAKGYVSGWGLEALFIPRFEPWKMAAPGSPWEFYRPDSMIVSLEPPPQMSIPEILLPVTFNWQSGDLPSPNLTNGEIGLKLSGFILGTDVSLLYLDAFQDNPVSQVTNIAVRIDSSSGTPVPQRAAMYLAPEYRRNNMYGFNFARPLGGTVVRGEIGYFNGYHFNRQPELTQEMIGQLQTGVLPEIANVVESDFLQAMVGADISGPFGSSLSVQYIHKQIMEYDPGIINNDEIETMITLMLSGTFWNEEGSARWLTLYDQNSESGLSRATFAYKLADAVLVETGVDILWGEAESFIGQFAGNDNAYLKIIYSF